jgi:hypothetical protein
MTGRKSLNEIRAELEAALGAGPAGDSEVANSLRRVLAGGACVRSPRSDRKKPRKRTGGSNSAPAA